MSSFFATIGMQRPVGGGGSASTPTLPSGYAVEVKASGDRLAVTFPNWTVGASYSLTPNATAKVTMLVTSAGYAGTTLGTRTRTVYATKVARKPYANQADQQETADGTDVTTDLWLSEPIYADDTIVLTVLTGWATDTNGGNEAAQTWTNVGITNSSTVPYSDAHPICRWNIVWKARYWDGTGTFRVSVCVAHGHASGGEQAAAVKFTMTDGVSTATKTVTASSLSSLYSRETTNGTRVVEYAADFEAADVSAFDDGDYTISCEVYPLIGDADAISTTADSADGFDAFTVKLDKAGAYPSRYAYVTGTAAGTPVTHATRAAAIADTSNTFGTVSAALVSIRAYNNSNHSHNDSGNGVVIIKNGTYDLSTIFGSIADDVGSSDVWCSVEAETAGSVTITESVNYSDHPGTAYCKLTGLSLENTAGADRFFFRFFNAAELWLDNVTVVDGDDYGACFYQASKIYATDCDLTDVDISVFSSEPMYCPLARATKFTSCNVPTYGLIGFLLTNDCTSQVKGTNQPAMNNVFIGFGKFNDSNVTKAAFALGTAAHNTQDVALVQVVLERSRASSSPLLQLTADSITTTAKNFVVQHITCIGQRANIYYVDTATNASKTLLFWAHNVAEEVNIKTDIFATTSTSIGNWSAVNGVGHKGSVYLEGYSDANFAYDFAGLNTYVGQTTSATVTFTNDASLTLGDGTGDGDYSLSSAGDLASRVLSGQAVLGWDLAGSTRNNDGTGAAGAYEA